MGFLSSMFDKSVFNQGSYAAAIGNDKQNGYAVVKISPVRPRIGDVEDPVIKGVVNTDEGGFSFNIKSEWRDFGGMASTIMPMTTTAIAGAFSKMNVLANAGGLASMGEAYASKLHWQKSNYMTIKIPMMVVDWNGEGQPILCAKLLAYYMLPLYLGNVGDIASADTDTVLEALKNYLYAKKDYNTLNKIEDMQWGLKSGLNKMKEGVANIANTTGATKAADSIGNVANQTTTGQVGGRIVKSALEDADDIITLRASPVPVRVQIGQYFDNDDMVITDADFQFSKEMTRSGPLFAKFNLSLSTRKILTRLDDVGLTDVYEQNSRFTEAKFT